MIDHVSVQVRDVAAADRAAVQAFQDAAVAAGVEVLHAPREWHF